MAFLTGSDLTGEVSITVFPNLYRRVATWLAKEQVILVSGKTETNRGSIQVVAQTLTDAVTIKVAPNRSKTGTATQLPSVPRWYLRLDAAHDNPATMPQLMTFLQQTAGQTPVILFRVSDDSKRVWRPIIGCSRIRI
nr:OB-fold nucleic acid binding domain-containing protein [Secundilactobacillus similis]